MLSGESVNISLVLSSKFSNISTSAVTVDEIDGGVAFGRSILLKCVFSAQCIYGKWYYEVENLIAVNLNNLDEVVGPFSEGGTHPITMRYTSVLVKAIATLNVSVRVNAKERKVSKSHFR